MASAWEFEKALFETLGMSHMNERLEFPHPAEDVKSASAPGILMQDATSEVAEDAGLEAAGHAKDVAQPAGTSSLNVKKLESLLAQAPVAADASPETPAGPGILHADAATPSASSGQSVKKLEAALAQTPVGTEASAWEFEKAIFHTHKMSHKNDRLEFPPAAEVADVAGLEAAGHAKDLAQPARNVKTLESPLAQTPVAAGAATPSADQSASGLNVKKLEATLAQTPVATEVADTAGLEAAGHAKDVAAPSGGSSLNVKKLEAALAQTSVGAEASPQTSSLNVKKLEDALAQTPAGTEAAPPAQPASGILKQEGAPSSEQGSAGLNIKKLEAALAQTPASTELADAAGLEAAGHAKDAASSPDKSSLNVKKLEAALAQTPVGADAPPQRSSAASEQPGVNMKKLEAALAQTPVATDGAAVSSGSALVPDAPPSQKPDSVQAEIADIAGLEAAGHLKDIAAASQPLKFTLKQSSESTSEVGANRPHLLVPEAEVSESTREVGANTPHLLVPEAEVPAKKTKTQVIHDMPHYRNHGVAMAHVETPRKAMSAEHEALAKEKAAKIAERRAEVQSAFHTSKTNAFSNPSPGLGAVPANTAQGEASFFRTPLLCILLFSLVALAYHKFEAIYNIYSGSSKKSYFQAQSDIGFRAKRDQDQESYSYGATVTGGHLSPMASGRQGLARRGAMDHCDYGV